MIDVLLTALVCKFAKRDQILKIVEEYGLGRKTVSASTSYFLIKALDAFWEVVVNDVANVAFINTHAESNSRTDYIDTVIDEVFLYPCPFFCRQSRMVNTN